MVTQDCAWADAATDTKVSIATASPRPVCLIIPGPLLKSALLGQWLSSRLRVFRRDALLLFKDVELIDMKHTLRPAPVIDAVVRSDLKVSRDVVNVGHPGVLRYRRRLDYLPRPSIDDRDGEAGG